jgi:hypothetical protein
MRWLFTNPPSTKPAAAKLMIRSAIEASMKEVGNPYQRQHHVSQCGGYQHGDASRNARQNLFLHVAAPVPQL